jgi:hypothetical protein
MEVKYPNGTTSYAGGEPKKTKDPISNFGYTVLEYSMYAGMLILGTAIGFSSARYCMAYIKKTNSLYF